MKNKPSPIFFVLCVFLLVALAGCDNAFHDKDKDDIVPLVNVRNVTFDPFSDCVKENVHLHNDIYYSGHYNNDGHGHHGLTADNVCSIADCQETNLHQHNGTHYTGHSGDDNCGEHHGNEHHKNV
jgi:hypothetical protein